MNTFKNTTLSSFMIPKIHHRKLPLVKSHNPDQCAIFQIDDVFSQQRKMVTICEVEEAIESTRSLSHLNKNDYFYSLSIDYEKVKKYYEIVRELETLYQTPCNVQDMMILISKKFDH
jgi:hypothetical protein